MTIIDLSQVPSRTDSNYPDQFKPVVAGREKSVSAISQGLKTLGLI